MSKDKLSWKNRLKLCFNVLRYGKYNPENYPSIKDEEMKARLKKMREDLASSCRPRTDHRSDGWSIIDGDDWE